MGAVDTEDIAANIKEMCIKASHYPSDDMACVSERAVKEEQSPSGKQILEQLKESLTIVGEDMILICQGTGMAVVFIKVRQEVYIEGGSLPEAIHEGVRQRYQEGYPQKSVAHDLIDRISTSDNTPAVMHYETVEGDQVDIIMAPRGFGDENMSRVFMLKPTDGLEGVKEAVLTVVKDAGPNAYPPMIVRVGIGGTFEKCVVMAKHALTRNLEEKPSVSYVRGLEEETSEEINRLGIEPGGFGGTVTALVANVETYPTHIAGLPVAVNTCYYVNRYTHKVL